MTKRKSTKEKLFEKVCAECSLRFVTQDDTRMLCDDCRAAVRAAKPFKAPAVTIIESGHAPGPWRVDETEHGVTVVIERDPTICFGSFSKNDKGRANARLVAAAPQLLEACQKATHIFNRLVNANPENIEFYEAIQEAWHATSHAYMRATSETYAELNQWDGDESARKARA